MRLKQMVPTVMATIVVVWPQLVAAEAQPGEGIVRPYLPGTLLFALIVAACHILAPQLFKLLKKREAFVGSFGGGMAVAYVFVVLLPELDKARELLGRFVFLLALGSFVLLYGLQELIARRGTRPGHPYKPSYRLRLLQLWVYNWLVVMGTPEDALEAGWGALPIIIGLAMHLIYMDYAFSEIFGSRFDVRGRVFLALAPLAGWLTAVTVRGSDERLGDIGVAILAGSLMYSVFKEELPDHSKSRFLYFLLGIVFFVALVLIEHTL